MIGRGCYGRPWFVEPGHRLAAGTAGACPIRRSRRSSRSCCGHYDDMLEPLRDRGRRRASRASIIGWYSKGLPGSAEFRAAVNQTVDVGAGHGDLIRGFYEPLLAREAA